MTDKHQIENKLRGLKLGGVLETLDIRLDQAFQAAIARTHSGLYML